MDYAKYFKKNGWASIGRYYIANPSKLKELLVKARKYASFEGLKRVKTEFLTICNYVRDVFTGNYKDYNVLNLIVIVGAIVYVVSPVDAIPDFIPAGFIDDTAILLWATKEFADELAHYKERMKLKNGTNPDSSSKEIEEIEFEEIPEVRKMISKRD